ncbi:MAG: hypothetical protein F6J89_32975 [Symploca sp. SIO1C4]|uniref:SWIM-type domain-containing protein n=1 Tax=Symploca sp. SIO1C4 TaxID=2607765 RepID=A0A6B3NMY3_9CYAN|nr:hypothetical protein [Symploca sp. SIO1C4]
MTQFSRTWWGKRFIRALESFSDQARLGRGRSYASGGRILKFEVAKGQITATVRGSINPYFGVYKEPRYETQIAIAPISTKDWSRIIQHLSSKASLVTKLLLGEVPDNIEESFAAVNKHLLPSTRKDFQTSCSCPDYANPCKHIAGLCYRFAAELDQNPFLLFELRGLSREALQAELAKSPLGKALSAQLTAEQLEPESTPTYYTELETVPLKGQTSLKEFWLGQKRLPQTIEVASHTSVPAILVKKQGDFPPFWHKDHSFLEVMEELYQRVRTKNRELI